VAKKSKVREASQSVMEPSLQEEILQSIQVSLQTAKVNSPTPVIEEEFMPSPVVETPPKPPMPPQQSAHKIPVASKPAFLNLSLNKNLPLQKLKSKPLNFKVGPPPETKFELKKPGLVGLGLKKPVFAPNFLAAKPVLPDANPKPSTTTGLNLNLNFNAPRIQPEYPRAFKPLVLDSNKGGFSSIMNNLKLKPTTFEPKFENLNKDPAQSITTQDMKLADKVGDILTEFLSNKKVPNLKPPVSATLSTETLPKLLARSKKTIIEARKVPNPAIAILKPKPYSPEVSNPIKPNIPPPKAIKINDGTIKKPGNSILQPINIFYPSDQTILPINQRPTLSTQDPQELKTINQDLFNIPNLVIEDLTHEFLYVKRTGEKMC
jgi:hypothetical protein